MISWLWRTQKHDDAAVLRASLLAAHRTIWMLVKENGGTVILNKETVEAYPGDNRVAVETTHQPLSGATIFRALSSNDL